MQIHEFSYQHDPSKIIPKQANEILRIGSAKKSTTVLRDMALNNDATIHGAMPTGDGFLSGVRRFVAANENYLDCGDIGDVSDGSFIVCAMGYAASSNGFIISKGHTDGAVSATSRGYALRHHSGNIRFDVQGTDTELTINSNVSTDVGRIYIIRGIVNKATNEMSLYVDGIKQTTVHDVSVLGTLDNTFDLHIGMYSQSIYLPYNEKIILSGVCLSVSSDTIEQELFNALAVLPFYRHVFTDYSNNATSLTTTFPGSSGIINSGSFNRTDGLKCTSAGTIVFSATNKFDGAEYIKVKIGGVWYAGTGTITQGTVTVAVSQGSNDITVSMGTNDVVQEILINFRAEV